MAKINNFDEANDESLTVEEKTMLQLNIRPEEVEMHYNWIVTRQLDHHPLTQTKVKLSASEDFVYGFYFVEGYGVEFNSRQPLQ